MSLIYYGQTAQLSSTANTVETHRLGKFLGVPFAFRAPEQLVHPSEHPMQYRGVAY